MHGWRRCTKPLIRLSGGLDIDAVGTSCLHRLCQILAAKTVSEVHGPDALVKGGVRHAAGHLLGSWDLFWAEAALHIDAEEAQDLLLLTAQNKKAQNKKAQVNPVLRADGFEPDLLEGLGPQGLRQVLRGWKGFATHRAFAKTRLERQDNAPASNLPTLPPERWRSSDLCSTATAPPWCLRNVWTWSGRAKQKLKGTLSANPPPPAGTLPRSAVGSGTELPGRPHQSSGPWRRCSPTR